MAKSSLSYTERQRIEFLTSHLRSLSRPSTKARYEDELAAEDTAAAQDFAAAYRSTAAE
ncbi:hypothetical protein [Pseudomonas syringae]|uniref:hypothetical protein n=1 Tax=Pseudomonas syringae TaxID=317 RepID=UPI00041AA4E0|nr:hypothetical protein [Pseudomonas syringae]